MSTSQAREIKKQWGAYHSLLAAEKNVEQSCAVWEQAFFLAEFMVIFPWFSRWYVFVTAVFEAGTEHKADDIEE